MTPQAFFDFVGPEAAKRFRKGILPFVDLFAGGGGTSSGVLLAMRELGIQVQLAAINHWSAAIATHELNHAGHLHFCQGVDRVDINDLLAESNSDGLFGLWGSPSCISHSIARGGVPINDQDRSTCWALVKWLRAKKAIHCFVENVPAFLDYGPLTQKRDKQGRLLFLRKDSKGQWRETLAPVGSKPKGVCSRRWWNDMEAAHGLKPAMVQDPKRKGIYFRKWLMAIRRLGYDIDYRVLNAADFGAPTKRLRLIVQAVRRSTGRRLVWPNPTHAEPDPNGIPPHGLLSWRCAREVIDWSDLGGSIFERKKALADKTIDRIAVGLIKFGLASAVVKMKGTGTANSVDAPLGTVQASGLHYGLMSPERVSVIIPQQRGGRGQLRVKSVDAPLGTVTGSGAEALATGTFVSDGAQTGEGKEPTNTAFLVPNFGERATQVPRTHSLDCPLPVVTSHGAGGLVSGDFEPFLVVSNHGNGPEGDKANQRRAKSLDSPLDTVTGSNSLAVVSGITATTQVGEAAASVEGWRDLSAAIKAGIRRSRTEPGYRPLISYHGCVFRLEIRFRMLNWRELARAQSFPDSYEFGGTATENVKMIGNAVPPALARAVVKAAISQNPDVGVIDHALADRMRASA